MFSTRRTLFVTALCTLMLAGSGLNSAFASPDAPGYAPPEVGLFTDEFAACDALPVIIGATGAGVGAIAGPIGSVVVGVSGLFIGYWAQGSCEQVYEEVQAAYSAAYLRAEEAGLSPGYPTNRIHGWAGVILQDFSGSKRGDGWGAIVTSAEGSEPFYVGGSTWRAYVTAVNETGIEPGYPINLEHTWPGSNVVIQDFRGGSWGDAAIIGGDQEVAYLVAGRHWEAYWRVEGQIRLGNPTSTWYQNGDGWYQQDFEGGAILELDHNIRVVFNDGTTEELYVE